jgi:hypothetical protein
MAKQTHSTPIPTRRTAIPIMVSNAHLQGLVRQVSVGRDETCLALCEPVTRGPSRRRRSSRRRLRQEGSSGRAPAPPRSTSARPSRRWWGRTRLHVRPRVLRRRARRSSARTFSGASEWPMAPAAVAARHASRTGDSCIATTESPPRTPLTTSQGWVSIGT